MAAKEADGSGERNAHVLLGAEEARPEITASTLIIGGGVAGFRAAIEAAACGSDVLLVTKDTLRESNTEYAQGGVAAAVGPDDSLQSHRDDTIEAGAELCEVATVERVVEEGPELLAELVEWGGQFDRQGDTLELGREGGHSRHRVVHAHGDATGREIVATLMRRLRDEPRIGVLDHTLAVDLLLHEGRCAGALLVDPHGRSSCVAAGSTVLCTGGAGQLYRETTNPAIATGDGLAMAWRAGAEMGDLEFMQFHPTTLYVAGSARKLITEAVRGEGAWLVDSRGERFVFRYDARGELAPRDIVSRATVQHLELTGDACVYLDLTHLGEWTRERFPGLERLCAIYGLDITTDRIPVHPSAHYMVGGCLTDLEGRTSLPGLLAAGEVALSGLHGANRLASNSLLEGLVFGRLAGARAAEEGATPPRAFDLEPRERELPPEVLNVADMRNSIQSLMWRRVGIMRRGDQLAEAGEQLSAWNSFSERIRFDSAPGIELRNLLQVALLVSRSALWREETRGTHCRTDHPEPDPDRFRAHSIIEREGDVVARPLREAT